MNIQEYRELKKRFHEARHELRTQQLQDFYNTISLTSSYFWLKCKRLFKPSSWRKNKSQLSDLCAPPQDVIAAELKTLIDKINQSIDKSEKPGKEDLVRFADLSVQIVEAHLILNENPPESIVQLFEEAEKLSLRLV